MERHDLVKFLAESAAELLDGSADADARRDEAAELLNLGARILSRGEGSATVSSIRREAA